jgi:hypothetical protein
MSDATQTDLAQTGKFGLDERTPEPGLDRSRREFIAKYLISVTPALRMKNAPELHSFVMGLVRELIVGLVQSGHPAAPSGQISSLGNRDLSSYSYVLQALLLWYRHTHDQTTMAAARRAADLICTTCLSQTRPPSNTGPLEVDAAVFHGLGQLYRITRENRYLHQMRQLEKHWEGAGDYLRTGLTGAEFFQTPHPRWESLHDLRVLQELHSITGDPHYRDAFEHHWRSIARQDRCNTGGLSGKLATGNPYSPRPVETSSIVAWLDLTADMLRLTGSAGVADELELSTFNAGLGAQDTSGRWRTHNPAANEPRQAAARSASFRARADSLGSNDWAVEGPRVLTLLPEWAVMRTADGIVVNYYGSSLYEGRLPDGTPITLRQQTSYPVSSRICLWIEPAEPRRFRLLLRIPAWAENSEVRLNQVAIRQLRPGRYFESTRQWCKGDLIELNFDMHTRIVPGDRESRGHVSLYRGPLLLAHEQTQNGSEPDEVPSLDLDRLGEARVLTEAEHEIRSGYLMKPQPWLMIEMPTLNGHMMRLCDFATASTSGARCRSWLAAPHSPPPPAVTLHPPDGATIPIQRSWFTWTGLSLTNAPAAEYRLGIADSSDFGQPLLEVPGITQNRFALDECLKRKLPTRRWCYWRVITVSQHGQTQSAPPPARFRIDPSLAPTDEAELTPTRRETE